jgi:uncharacterized protein YabN with tetrapyrrole methylase and pyrophosphatase domain
MAVIGEDEGRFDLGAVAGGLIAKMVRRHPHVFGDAEYQGRGHQAMSGGGIRRSAVHARQPTLETLDDLWDEVKELERA